LGARCDYSPFYLGVISKKKLKKTLFISSSLLQPCGHATELLLDKT